MSWRHQFADLIERRVGIDLRSGAALTSAARVVESRAVALGLSRPEDYLDSLAAAPIVAREFSRLMTVLTNGMTCFFRERGLFERLGEWLQQRSARAQRPMEVWSAGCATGEEAYSLAIMCEELGIDARIVASDINAEFLALARNGEYGEWTIRRVPEPKRKRYFVRQGAVHRVCDAVRDRVMFQQHNLVDPIVLRPAGASTWDLILCQNVLIYFSRQAVDTVTRFLASCLDRDAWLLLGPSERLTNRVSHLAATAEHGRLVYRLPSAVATDSPRRAEVRPPVRQQTGVRVAAGQQTGVCAAAQQAAKRCRPRQSRGTRLEPLPTVREAARRIAAGDLERARGGLETRVASVPADTAAWLLLGNLHLRAHDFDKALEAYVRVHEQDPLCVEGHFAQGVLFRKVADLERAEQALRRALFLAPDHWPASFLLAGVYERLGKADLRRRELRRTAQLLEAGADMPRSNLDLPEAPIVELKPGETLRYCQRVLPSLTSRGNT